MLGASLTIALFGTMVHVLRTMFGMFTQVTLRALIAAVIMAGVFLILRRRPHRLHCDDWLKTIIVGFCGSLTLGLFAVVAIHDKAASATFLVFAGAILTSLVGGIVFLGEKATPLKLLAIALVIIGLLLYAHGFTYKGVITLAGLLGGVSDGVANILRKKMHHLDRPTVVTYQYVVGALAAGLYVLLSHEQPIVAMHWLPIVVMVLFAVLALVLGTLLLYGYARVDMQTGAVLSAMQVFFAIVLGMVFLRQMPTAHEIVGCFLISVASCLAVLDPRKVLARLRRRTASQLEATADVEIK
jgi:drug/metabolite transporter (DMT)-like permease